MIFSIKALSFRLSYHAVVRVLENTQLWQSAMKFGNGSYRILPCFAACGRTHRPEGSWL